MEVVPYDTPESLGNIAYKTEEGWGMYGMGGRSMQHNGRMPPEMGGPTGYALKSWHFDGIGERHSWRKTFTAYPDFQSRLFALETTGWDKMGYGVADLNGWKYFTRDDAKYVVASAGNFLLFGKTTQEHPNAVVRSREHTGFHFSAPDGFETDGAFYRDQSDLSKLKDQIFRAIAEKGGEQLPPMAQQIIPKLMDGLGFEALSKQDSAMFLRNGDIEEVKRVELTGQAKDTPIGAMVYWSRQN